MFEGAVAGFLNWLLGKYIQDLDTENLNGGIFSGVVNLTDLKLKPEALYELDLPIDVKIGTIGKVNIRIPWTGLYSQPVVLHLEDVLILVGPAISNSYFDPEREKRLTRAAKRKILQDLEAESEMLKGPQNLFKNLFTTILNNLEIYLRNVHVRYEDSISSKDGPLACGLCLQSLSIETTNNKWKPALTPADASTMYKIMRVESLSLYWNPTATALDDVEIANITPMQYYNWKHYMLTGLDKFSMHHEDFEFLLKPVACKVKVLMSRSVEPRVPRLLLDAVLQDSEIQLSRRQYLSIDNLMKSFERITLNRKYRHLHPGVPLAKDPKKWWRYVYNAVVEQRVRPYTWAAIKRHRENYNVYKQTYKSTLRSPNDTELKLDLQKCEDSLPIISVVIAREQAKFELLAQEPDRIEVVETEIDWWDPLNSDRTGELDDEKSRVDLCVKTARSKSLWSHLSSPEKRKVCELIGYVEGAPRQDKSKQHIEHKLNLTLANSSITLINRNKEVLVVTLTQFLASLETRPHDKAFKISTRTEGMVIEGLASDNELIPILVMAQSLVIGGHTAFALDIEKNPANSHADLGICCHMEPLDIIYVEHAVTELINFFQTHSMSSEDLVEEACQMVQKAGVVSKSVLAYAVSRKKVFHVNMDLKGPCLVLPEYGCAKKPGHVLVFDVNRIVIKSDLQPPNLTLEDATCMELEERLYDRFHAECSFQVLFCDTNEPLQEARRLADSVLHLVPRVKAQLVFSTSIKKDYKLLPRYKLNISLSSLKLNLFDRTIGHLLDFCDNLPVPVPNTVPVSFMDSGDYVEEMEDPDLIEILQFDKVGADPGYRDLIKLRQNIVAAYFSRNRAAETQADGMDAQSPAEESLPTADFSDEDVEEYARSVDLPGFDDNVSPSNTINTLMRFVIGEIVINLYRDSELKEKPFIVFSVSKVCLDLALMEYGPAIQLSVGDALLADKQHGTNGEYLELLTSTGELFNLLYRKVRADCPEFRSHFHSVERSLVADVNAPTLLLHATALRTLFKYLTYIQRKIQKRHSVNVSSILPKTSSLWDYLMQPEADPPVPPGATKFSYSVRVSSASVRLWAVEGLQLEIRLLSLESDCVFRANDRLIFKMFLGALHVDDLSEDTLYPKLVWPDEDKVIEAKYVRAASGQAQRPAELRVYVGRLHVVLFCSLVYQLQQLMESIIPSGATAEATAAAERAAVKRMEALRTAPDRLSLAIEIHGPVFLLPQKPSSPNLLVFNTGDLLVENFFKTINTSVESATPIASPVVDNILVKLVNVTLSRAVMTLAGTLEVQEPILEPISVKCDMKRTLSYAQVASTSAYRDLLLCEADVVMDMVILNLGQKDLATVLAVWSDNLIDGNYMSTIVPTSPVEVAPSDVTVKKLQAFFAQGEPIRKESVVRFTLDGVEMKLFSDMDEVLSSPVRDLSHGLAKLTAGEATLLFDHYSDGSLELRASLQSLLIEDIRPDTSVVIRKILESQGGGRVSGAGGRVSVARPALLEAVLRRSARAVTLDLRLERTRLNLSPPFLLRLARALLEALPGERLLDGGEVNHGYVGDVPTRGNNNRSARFPSTSESTSGYYSAGTGNSSSEEPPSLSISVQCRQPEVMFFTDLTKPEGQALLFRTELLIDYSSHSNTESLVISLAGLQIMSKLQSKLKNLAPQCVLKPCDLEFSKSFKNVEEGIVVRMSMSEIDVHIAATTVHTVMDIIEEITTELTSPYEKELYHYVPFTPQPEKVDENLWSPKKIDAYVPFRHEDTYVQPKYPIIKPSETFIMTIPNVRVMFELEQSVRVPVLSVKLSAEGTFHDWSRQLHGGGSLTLQASTYNDRLDVWEPLIEPLVEGNRQRPWDLTVTMFQEKAYPMSAQQVTKQDVTMTDEVPAEPTKRMKKREFESETSADEADTDNEMVFIRNPSGKQNKGYSVDLNACHMSLGVDESDSENEEGKDKLSNAIGQLFTDSDSSADEYSNDEDSSAPEQSEAEESGGEEKPVSYVDGQDTKKKEKVVTVQEPSREREDSVESSDVSRWCLYLMLESRSTLNCTLGAAGARVLRTLGNALTDRTAAVTALVTENPIMQLVNDIGPGSTVQLRTHAQTDIAGNDLVLAVADYEYSSRPSTPGGDLSGTELLEEIEKETKQEMTDISDEWDCFEGGFPASAAPAGASHSSPGAPPSAQELLRRVTDLMLSIRLHDFEQLTILCPQRSASKLHVLHPSKSSTRYYVAVDRTAKFNNKKIVVRSPLQIRNETSYAMEMMYRQSELEAAGVYPMGSVRNPFCGLLRLAVLAPQETYNVPLYVAYHCRLYLVPTNFESYQAAAQGIWWMELANDIGTPRDIVCPSMDDGDSSVFAMRVVAVEGCQTHKVSRTIPNLLIRVLPPLGVHNRLPHAMQLTGENINIRVEAGERAHVYTLQPGQAHKLTLEIQYLGLPWSGSFTMTPDMLEKTISMTTHSDIESGFKRLIVRARLRQGAELALLLYSPCWIINKTGLPLQIKGRSDACYSVTEEALLWGERSTRGMGAELVAGAERVRVRAQQSCWSRAARLLAHAPGLLVCAHAERRLSYRILLHVTLSELCPQLTKIVTLLPYFIVYNDTRRHLRFMEENEAADLWIDLAPQQCIPFWPQTDSMAMHCKYRDSNVVSQHFPITTPHFTVLRMDKGSAICVDVTGGTDRPFIITFKTYSAGDAPVRIDNLCDDLFLKMHQVDSGQVALLSPYQSMLYTWDDPLKERKLSWNIYTNKGKGFIADFSQDGHGEVKVSYRSVKNSTVVKSVTSKLSSTLNRLAPKSPEPCSSSSDDSDSSGLPEIHAKGKKLRKDKVIVYWTSFIHGYQRIFALAQDEKIICHYRTRIHIERSIYEIYLSLASIGLSVCVPTNNGEKELSYVSVTDSIPKWEIHVSNKWKQLAPDITAWIEEKYQTEQKKCQLKEFLHIDLEKMHMTKPFFSELRRIYSPGLWLQLRKSNTFTYRHLKLYSLQIDNQLHEAVYPNVLHPAPVPNLKTRNERPAIEIVTFKEFRPDMRQEVYKYFKILIQEYCVNLDRGFVNYVFDILNNWKVEEKPAVRLRADLALVHMPLPVIAMKSQTSGQKDVIFEFVHLSPIKLVLSLSSRGYSTESGGSPTRTRYGQRENRPKLFNSDLLEFLFNSWGSSLCDMKDVVIKMNFLELQNAPVTVPRLLDAASRHYWLQLVQQFYVLVLGLNILGNPYSYIGDFTKGLTHYYEPYLGSACGRVSLAGGLLHGAFQMLRCCFTSPSELHKLRQSRRSGEEGDVIDDLPEEVIEAYRTNPTSVALALIGLIARPSFDEENSVLKYVTREATRLASARASSSCSAVESAEAALRACVERGSGLVARKRLPRFCSHIYGIRAYCSSAARGAALLALLSRGHYADTDSYVAHAHLSRTSLTTILVSTQHIFLVRTGGAQGGWRVEWAVQLDELIGAPIIRDGKLILNIKQDEMVNYFSTDEKVIEIQDPEVLTWLQKKIECTLIQALEDKRCTEQ